MGARLAGAPAFEVATVIAWCLVGGAVGVIVAGGVSVLLLAGAPVGLRRDNFRGNEVVMLGVAPLLGFLAAEGILSLAWVGGTGTTVFPSAANVALLLSVPGLTAVGLLDDLAGDGATRGFSGHLGGLARGKLSTGAIKVIGGGVCALVAGAVLGRGMGDALGAGALIALSANAANALDVRPGRALKVWVAVWVIMAIFASPAGLVASASLMGCCVALLPLDLRERGMLGDAGANPLGAALGVMAASTWRGVGIWAGVGTLLVLELLGDRVSLTAVIERVPPLRWLDAAGRRPG